MAGAKAAAEPASRVAMASFIMVAGVLFFILLRRDDGIGKAASNNKAGGSWILCVPLVEHVSLHRDTDSKVE